MIIKSNRFFGKDISNISNIPSLNARNTSQDACKQRKRKLSISSNEAPKNRSQDFSKRYSDQEQKCAQKLSLPNGITSTSQCIPQYFAQIFDYIKSHQKFPLGNYCEKSINISKNQRGQIINWIIDVHYKFKLFPQTLYFIVYFMDSYLAQKNIQKSKVKLLAIACLFLAAKYEETYRVPSMKDLLNLCSFSYTKKQIIDMQAQVIKCMNFDLIFDSCFKYLEGLEAFSDMNKKNFHLAQYLLQLSMTQSEFLEYSQSLLACSAFYLVCKIRKVDLEWEDQYRSLTGFKQSDLHKCARQLCNLLEKIDKMSYVSSLKKKFSEAQFHQVTRLKLQRKK